MDFLSKVKFGNPNTEGAVDLNGRQKYVSDYDYWRDYKKSFEKHRHNMEPNIPFVLDKTDIGTGSPFTKINNENINN